MRCDLHVHTIASGMFNLPGLSRVCRECYCQPQDVYHLLRRRGMTLITLTDHDSIESAEVLRSRPDFFLSEEVTVQMPSGTEAHLGVYNLAERDHMEIQRLRNDLVALLMYLKERKLFFSVNHMFSSLTGPRAAEDFDWFESCIPAYETRNGQMHRKANEGAANLAVRLGKIATAGSDSHAPGGAGLTYTEVPGARTADEFFAGLRAGRGQVAGAHGSYAQLTADVLSIATSLFADKPWALAVSPLALLAPIFTWGHWMRELHFCNKWRAALENGAHRKRGLRGIDSHLEANWAG
jgi:predicted metal-dependent phosphoesterase TrpH